MVLFFLEEVQIGPPSPRHDLPHFPLSPPLPMYSKKEPENGFVTIIQWQVIVDDSLPGTGCCG